MALSFEQRRRQIDAEYRKQNLFNDKPSVSTTPSINLSTLPTATPSAKPSSFTNNYFNQLNNYSSVPPMSTEAENRRKREEEERKRKEQEEERKRIERERQSTQNRKQEISSKQGTVQKQGASLSTSKGGVQLDYVNYLSSDTKDLLDEGKSWNKTGKLSEEDKIQKQLYDYYKDWWKNNDKKTRDTIFETLQEQKDRENERTLYGNDKTGAKVFGEFLRGVGSGATVGATDLIEGAGKADAKKMAARQDQSWYSAYNIGQIAGSFLPIGLGIRAAKTGLQKVAPKVFKESAEDTARKKIAKRISTELAADLAAGTTYGVAQEAMDAAFDTRGDGKQTFGQRAEKVATDAALGVVLGLGIEGVGLGYNRIQAYRNTKTKNAEIDLLISNPEDIAKVQDDITKTATTIERLNKRLEVLKDADESKNKVVATQRVTEKLNELNAHYNDLNKLSNDINKRIDKPATLTKEQKQAVKEQEVVVSDTLSQVQFYTKQVDNAQKQVDEAIEPDEQLFNDLNDAIGIRDDFVKQLDEERTKLIFLRNPERPMKVNTLTEDDIMSIRQQVDDEWNQTLQSRTQSRNEREQNRSIDQQRQQDKERRLQLSNQIIELQNEMKRYPTMIGQNTQRIEELRAELLTLRNKTYEDLFDNIPQEEIDAYQNRVNEVNTQEQLARTSTASRLANVLDQRARASQQMEDTFSPSAMAERNRQKRQEEIEARNQERQAEEQARLEQERVAREELPYEDVPIERTGRMEYVIDNVSDYVTNTTKKAENVTNEANSRIETLTNNRDALLQEKENYLNDNNNIQRAIAEYDQWVKLVQTINALTKNGNGIKLSKGQKVPGVFKKGTIPIQSVADRLGVSVDELISQMNVYQNMISLSVKKQTTLVKKKRELAKLKLSQEQGYKDIQSRMDELDEVISAIEEIKPRTYEYTSRTTSERIKDIDEETYNQLLDMGSTASEDVIPTDSEFLSGYLVEKWFPESADQYRKIESQIDTLQNQIEAQEDIIREVTEDTRKEFKELSNYQSNEDSLARMLVDYVKSTKKRIHLYASEEDYRLRKMRGKELKTKDLPGWTKGYIQLKPSRKYDVTGQRKSATIHDFMDYVRSSLFDSGDFDGVSKRTDQAYGVSDSFDDVTYNDYDLIEKVLDGNPYANLMDMTKFNNRVEGKLATSFDENPKTSIKKLQGQIDDLRTELVKVTNYVMDKRLSSIDNLPDDQLVTMIRDIKGEEQSFDELLDDYMKEVYPERVTPDIEPISVDGTPSVQNATPSAKPTNNLPQSPIPNEAPTTSNLPTRQADNTMPTNTVETPVTRQEQAPVNNDMPMQETPVRTQETPVSEQSTMPNRQTVNQPVTEPVATSKPVDSAPANAPINQPNFAEQLREEPTTSMETGNNVADDLPTADVPTPSSVDGLPRKPVRRERGFNRTVRTSENTSEELRTDVQVQTDINETASLVDNPNWYGVKPNQISLNEANSFIDSLAGSYDKKMSAAKSYILKQKIITSKDNAIAQIVTKYYMDAGDFDNAMELLNKVAKSGTELGRAVQMFTVWNKLDTNGVLYLAQRAINNRNARIDNTKIFTFDKKLDANEVPEPIQKIANNLPKIDEIKTLSIEVKRIVESKKLGEPLTQAEVSTLSRFEQLVNEVKDELPKKPSADEVINTVEKIEPKLRQRDLLINYLDALAENARKRLNKGKNNLNSMPFREWRDLAIIGASYIAKGVVKLPDFTTAMLKYYDDNYQTRLANYNELETFKKDVLAFVNGRGVVTAKGQRLPSSVRNRDKNTSKDVDRVDITELAKHFKMSVDDFLDKINKFNKPVQFNVIDVKMRELYNAAMKRFRKERGLPQTTDLERIVKKAIKDNKITGDDADNLMRMATEAGFVSDEFRIEMIGNLQIALRNLEGHSFLRKLATTQTIAQLLNPKTLIRNTLGNELFYATEKASKLLSVPIDMVTSKVTGKNREIYFFTGNQEKYWKNWLIGAKAGWKGYAPDGITSQYDLDSQVFSHKYNPLTYLEKALGVTLRSFDYAAYKRAYGEAQSSWAKGIAQAEGLSGQAMKDRMQEIMKGADDEINAVFDEYGKYMTFQDDNLLSNAFVGAKRIMNFNQEFGLGDLVLKYPKTPANLLMRAIDFSPVGIARGFSELVSAAIRAKGSRSQYKAGFDKRAFTESIARGAIGTGLTAVGFYLYDLGILTGSVEKDRDLREVYKSAGVSPYQVNVSALERLVFSGFNREEAKRKKGDLMLTYDWVQPMAVNLAVGTKVAEQEKVSANSLGTAWDAFDTGLTVFTEQPLVQGLTKLFTTYPNSDNGIPEKLLEVAQGLPSSFTPTIANQFRTLEDNTKRITTDNTDKGNPFLNKVLDRLPYASRSLPVDYDALGRPKEKYQDGSNNAFNVFLNPSFATRYNPDEISKNAIDLVEKSGNKQVAPRIPTKSLKDDAGNSGKLSPEQYSQLSKIIGEKQRQYLKEYADVLNDKSIPQEVRIQYYEKILDYANAEARDEFRAKTNYKARPK